MLSDYCCALGCSEYRGRKSSKISSGDISFHGFPVKDEKLLRKWIHAIRRDNWEPNKYSKICSKHFTPDCFNTSGWSSLHSLRNDAVPSIFNFSDVSPNDRKESLLPNYVVYEKLTNNFSNIDMHEESVQENICNSSMEDYIASDSYEQHGCEFPEKDSRNGDSSEPNLCRFCTKPVDEFGKDIYSEDAESVKIQEMVNNILPGQVEPTQVFIESETPHNFFDQYNGLTEQELLKQLESSTNHHYDIFPQGYEDCDFCFTRFTSFQDLEFHMKMKHPLKLFEHNVYSCVKCLQVFTRRSSLLLHTQSCNPTKDFVCEDRPKVKQLLTERKEFKHGKYICKECGEKFHHVNVLDHHLNSHDNSKLCSICGKEIESAYWYKIHEQAHKQKIQDNRHLCWICGKLFKTKTSFDLHLQSHDGLKVMPYKCKICSKEYHSVSGLNKHKLIHKERVRCFKCTKCEKDFYTNEALKQHLSSHSNLKPFKCHCGVAFKRKINLHTHKNRHLLKQNSNKPEQSTEINKDKEVFTCSVCGKEVVSKLKFKYHMGKHTGNDKPFDCEICGTAFGNLTNYKNHIRIHSSELLFVCEVCGLGFRTGRMLKQHQLVHEEERPYACPSCPVSFKRLYSLKEHKIVHSGLRPYKCTLCSKAFARKSDCRKHLKRTHKKTALQLEVFLQNVTLGEQDGSSKHEEEIP